MSLWRRFGTWERVIFAMALLAIVAGFMMFTVGLVSIALTHGYR